MKDLKDKQGLGAWLDENPLAVNLGMGLLKTYDEGNRASALAPYEIAKTQYGYLTGVGPGKVSLPSKTPADRLLQSYMTGSMMAKNDKLNKAWMDFLAKEKGGQGKARPTESLTEAIKDQNPVHPVLIERDRRYSMDDAAQKEMEKALGVGYNQRLFMDPKAVKTGGLPSEYAYGPERDTTERDKLLQEKLKELRGQQRVIGLMGGV